MVVYEKISPTAQPPNRPTAWLIFSLFIFFFIFSSASIHARRFSPFSMPVGAKTTIKGREVIKVTKTGKFVDLAKWNALGNTTMQGWDDCASLVTPTGTNFTQGPILTDLRDNKQYEIRKFADGKCWMVDNLMYGGETDACAGKSTFNGNGSATASNQFGAGTFGDCRDPRVGGSAPCTAGSTTCGYYYNWQAAMQHASAYYNTTYTGPTTNVQGLCPEGWRMPNGGLNSATSDFVNLDMITGGSGSNRSDTTNTFWRATYSYKGFYAGFCIANGTLYNQNSFVIWQSNNQHSNTYAYTLFLSSSSIDPLPKSNNGHKAYGFSIRCLKN